MSRNRESSSDIWTWETDIDCAPMTRLLFLGRWNVADDFAVIRMQVFPGDTVDCEAARGLVRHDSVDGQDHTAIVDRDRPQRAKRRLPSISEADQRLTRSSLAAGTIANHSNRPPTSRTEGIANHSNPQPASRMEDIANHSNRPPTSRAKDIANHSNPPSTCVEEDWQAVIALASLQGSRTAPRMTGALDLPHVALGATRSRESASRGVVRHDLATWLRLK